MFVCIGIFGLGSLTWQLHLGIFGLGSLAWDLWLLGSLALDLWLWLGIFGLVGTFGLAWDFGLGCLGGLGPVAWEFGLGPVCLGIYGLGSLAADRGSGEFKLGESR